MKKPSSRWLAIASLVAGLGASFSASATWTFTGVSGGDTTAVTANPSTDPSLTISGAYAANGGLLPTGALGTAIVPTGTACLLATCGTNNTYGIAGFASSGTAWAVNTTSQLQFYAGGGLGMASDSTGTTAPNHALDNGPSTGATNLINGLGNTEAVFLTFSSSVVLSGIEIGYKSGDADISLFRFIGTGAPTTGPTLAGTTASGASMTTAGWELVGNYGDLVTTATTAPYNAVNAGNKGSSWWLVSAYNTSYGLVATTGTVDQGNDYFKILAVAGSKCVGTTTNCGPVKVPEPGSLALVSVGLMGALGLRRRRSLVGNA